MQLKRTINLFLFSCILLSACDPMHDIDKALDAQEELEKAGGKSTFSKALTYTMTESDYKSISKAALAAATNASDSALAKAVASQFAFNNWATSSTFAPALLKNLFPGVGNGSTVTLTSNYVADVPLGLEPLNGISSYTLIDNDYPDPTIEWFSPKSSATDYLPEILKNQFPNAQPNDLQLAFYNYSDGEISYSDQLTTLTMEDFESGYEINQEINTQGWSQYLPVGSYSWVIKTYNDNQYAQFSSYKSKEANEAWLISKEYDLTNIDNAELSFKTKYRNVSNDHTPLMIKISADYLEDASKATWTDVSDNFSLPTEMTDNFVSSGQFSLKNYKDKKIRVAFVYLGDDTQSKTTTVQIDEIQIQQKKMVPVSSAPIYKKNQLYQYSGSAWIPFTEVILDPESSDKTDIYCLQSNDYDEMGSGPGYRDNFSSSVNPDDYIPQFLALKYPYAQPASQLVVIYQYYSNKKLNNQAGLYTFNESRVWEPYATIQTRDEQFVNNGTNWLFDPTITFTMGTSDYQAIVDWVAKVKGDEWLDYRYIDKQNAEMWCGASSYYSNMDFTLSLRRNENCDPTGSLKDLTDEQCENLFQKRITEDGLPAVLKARYPDMPAMTSGVAQYYQVIYLVYPSRVYYMTKYKGLGNGEFEYVEGPTAQ